MKKYYFLILLSSFILFLFACSKDFLDKQPEDTLSPGTFYTNVEEVKTGLVSCYKVLQYIYGPNKADLPLTVELMSDDGKDAYMTGNFNTFNKTDADSHTSIWTNSYKLITNCNNILYVMDGYEPKDASEEADIKAFRGEALFLRALAYFNLVRIYGDVPMVIQHLDDPSSVFGIGRTPVGTIYNEVIIPDLESAVENCYRKGDAALSGEEARATKGAALTILGKVYLTLKNDAKAAETLKKLIVDNAAGSYSLLPDFANIFKPENKFNDESIFEVNFNVAAGQPNYYYLWMGMGIATYLHTSGSSRLFISHHYMRDATDSQDFIRYALMDSGYVISSAIPYQAFTYKFTPPRDQLEAVANTGTDYNYMVTRYADALLMYAEALMNMEQKDEALPYFNQVRTRAGLPPITAAQLDIDMILHERRLELAFEGHRYFDLVRTGKAIQVLTDFLTTIVDYDNVIVRTTPIPEYQLLLPIPVGQIEIDRTLTQNPGY